MRQLSVSNFYFSQLFWQIIFDATEASLSRNRNKIQDLFYSRDILVEQAEYKTGSVNLSSMYTLYALAAYFQPERVAEVGTFIGKTTGAIASAMESYKASQDLIIYTCDYSNDILIPKDSEVEIEQFPKQSSSQMFDELNRRNIKIDFFFIDGRIDKSDIGRIGALAKEKSIYVLDDFEGTEKGVINSILLANLLRTHFLIYPVSRTCEYKEFSIRRNTTAVLMPIGLFSRVNQ
jgi:hypothetical protein